MQIRVIVQSRLSSKRLPAKALLPICDIPSVVLCAKRAGNLGLPVTVATSNELEDNLIVNTLDAHGIAYVRGSLNCVLDRFLLATQSMNDDDIIVRLTADNLFPDGALIKDAVDYFIKMGSEFLTTTFPESPMPYGLSIEIFKVKTLRHLTTLNLDSHDKEHVTSWILRNIKNKHFYIPTSESLIDRHHLRCTLDTFHDYLSLQKVFSKESDPIQTSWVALVQQLTELYSSSMPGCVAKTMQGARHSRLTLGTAQIGLAYGKTNKVGLPDERVAREIIDQSVQFGITSIDTASAYGLAEKRVGAALAAGRAAQINIVTKLNPLAWIDEQTSDASIVAGVDASIYQSCHSLGLECLPVLMLHRWQHYYQFQGKIWQRLLVLQQQGIIRNLGASVYTPEEAMHALLEPSIKYLQIPFNILDWRWLSDAFLKAIEKRPDVIIHARSALLQGILAAEPAQWPKVSMVNPEETIKVLDHFVNAYQRKNRADLCYAYVRSFPWITSVVVGIESIAQLHDNLSLFQQPELNQDQIEDIRNAFTETQAALLNPAEWQS